MAIPTPVDAQITDSVTQTLLTVTGPTGVTAVSHSRQVAAQAVALLMANATAAQQRGQTVADAVVAVGVKLLERPAGRVERRAK